MGDVATKVRRGIARINEMSQDRPDLSAVAKVISQHMSKPREGVVRIHKRCVRYPGESLKRSMIWWLGLTVIGLEM